MNPHHHSQTSSYLSASCFILYLSKYSTLQWDICEINSRTLWLGRCSVPPPHPLLLSWGDWEWQLRGFRTGIVLSPCHPLQGWSAAGVAVRWEPGHTVVLFWEKKRGPALLPGGSCWQRQLWLCVSSKSYSISCPFCPSNRWPHTPT